MAFVFAYSLDGDEMNAVIDLPLDTLANYKTSGTNGPTKGDLVFQSSGLLRRNGATTGAGVGVLEGIEFTGLVAQGQPYAATNASFTASAINTTLFPNGVGKVRANKSDVVYRIPVYYGGTITSGNLNFVGQSYALHVDANGDQTLDPNTTTTPAVKVVQLSTDLNNAYVQLV